MRVDPGRASAFTFFQEGMSHQEHRKVHEISKARLGMDYVLGPFGLPTKLYHHHIGTYTYNRPLLGQPLGGVEGKNVLLEESLLVEHMTTGGRVRGLVGEVAEVWERRVVSDLQALEKLFNDGKKQRFFRRLAKSLRARFSADPVIAFGNATVRLVIPPPLHTHTHTHTHTHIIINNNKKL